jgi:hypothetical protein
MKARNRQNSRRAPRWRSDSLWVRLLLLAALIVPLSGCAVLAGAAAGGGVGYVAGHEAGKDAANND